MAVTALKVGDQRIKFMTLPAELIKSKDGETEKLFLTVDLRVCDENFIPAGVGSISVHGGDEESYHKALRQAATEKGHFVPEESTDHQWNPGYDPAKDVETEEHNPDGDTV